MFIVYHITTERRGHFSGPWRYQNYTPTGWCWYSSECVWMIPGTEAL